ncbi:MAG: GHKL domain-containing protein [Alphaproteobacteria bacterium]|nr:GHKL domain-containing protein [Alphaproteobacteria bacterium]HPF46359.1 ATP-binding protein [Emcibacteraceae bacterium]
MKSVSSLKSKLSLWLAIIIICFAALITSVAFYVIFNEGIEWQDDTLKQVAELISEQPNSISASYQYDNPNYNGTVGPIFIQMINQGEKEEERTNKKTLKLPAGLSDGIQTVKINNVRYRVFVKTVDEDKKIAVIQSTDERDMTAKEGTIIALITMLLLIPVMIFSVILVVKRILLPLAEVAKDIEQRKEPELNPITADNIPEEIIPFVMAINRLFGRIKQSMDIHKRFITDAAHELRSPMTAISLQAERLAKTELTETAKERLETLRSGISRSRILLDQLLVLARIQAPSKTIASSVSIVSSIRLVLEDILPLAEAKNIDIGLVGETDARISMHEIDLISLIKNLAINAIKYTPQSGKVDLSVNKNDKEVIFEVKDNGPGIPEKEWERVFDPFYRVLGNDEVGSGLGLSIVRVIAEQVDAEIKINYADPKSKSGLKITVIFPSSS